jgi:hypothetical protein
MPKSSSARVYIALIIVSGVVLLADAVLNARSVPAARFFVLVALAAVAARLKVKLPGITGVMSVNLPFILLAVALTGTAEALAVGFVSTLAQSIPRSMRKANFVQIAFNCCAITLAVGLARWIYASPEIVSVVSVPALRLALAAAGYFVANTVLVALVISLTEPVSLVRTWAEMFQLSFVYLVASAGVAGLALLFGQGIGWQVPLALLPIMLGVYQSYRRFFAAAITGSAANTMIKASGATAGAHI